ncbi:AbrB/MazE/SpoVT family DNA-binding domain-containing protein [Candidatus Berkelbacteria bacterium]|nr:AbrB/MazE/SpoVT family DNA-binding domain-containing protein [Candidatus Berkelbacteria bacterium]
MSKVMQKGQVVIPAKLRKRYSLTPGSTVVFEPTKRGLVVKSATDIVEELMGKYRGLGKGRATDDLIKLRREEVKHDEKEFKSYFRR